MPVIMFAADGRIQEFSTGFARMQGRRALFPQGFHCSGMPIKAAADKIAREMELFGPRFEEYREEEEPITTQAADPQAKTDLGKFGGSKSKAVAKTGAVKYQFQVCNRSQRHCSARLTCARLWLPWEFPSTRSPSLRIRRIG